MTENSATLDQPDEVEEMFDPDVPEGGDRNLAYYVVEMNWYKEGFENELPGLEATITDVSFDENGESGTEIRVRFVTGTGRTIERFFGLPTMVDTPETNRFLRLLETTGTSPADPLRIIGKNVPIVYDRTTDSVDVSIPLPDRDDGAMEPNRDPPAVCFGKDVARSVAFATSSTVRSIRNDVDRFLRCYTVSVRVLWLLAFFVFLIGGGAAAAGNPSVVTAPQGAIGAIVTSVLGALYYDTYGAG